MAFWESVPGKALILLFYAFIANLVLVQADGRINDITGVSTEHFPYTHNMSVLLSLPNWLFITSILMLLFMQVFMTFYVMVLFLLKPLRLKPFWHQSHYRFPATTAVIRLIMCFALMVIILAAAIQLRPKGNEDFFHAFEDLPFIKDKLTIEFESTPETETKLADTEDEPKKEIENEGFSYGKGLNKFLAYFIFELESDEYSRCEHSEGSNVVELNDFEILEIVPDETAEYGYTYTVKPCISAAIGHQFKSPQP
ncbi:hypothetical protein ACSLBF_01545 [Pseudoalteromonas sp. T1lg65]|uniref:hypothetical protein n=1 Tax=Pseudoalteromonas sp. T1lg65 TaxID=2077101 RepID=UPI003F79F47B